MTTVVVKSRQLGADIELARSMHEHCLASWQRDEWLTVGRLQRKGLIRVKPISRHFAELFFVEPAA